MIPGASRGIQLKDYLREQIGLPLIGRVAAGRPILAEEHVEGRFQIDPQLFQPRPHYLLKVSGMSMRDVGIVDGDLVAVHRTSEVRNRQIVVARLENEVTVKRYRQEGSIVWLMPENADFQPIRVDLKAQPMIIEGCRRGESYDASMAVCATSRASGARVESRPLVASSALQVLQAFEIEGLIRRRSGALRFPQDLTENLQHSVFGFVLNRAVMPAMREAHGSRRDDRC